MNAGAAITPTATPALADHVRLQRDKARDCWIIQAPERVLFLDEVAVEVLRRLDGERSVRAIAENLADEYDAPVEEILNDVLELLNDLAAKGIVKS